MTQIEAMVRILEYQYTSSELRDATQVAILEWIRGVSS